MPATSLAAGQSISVDDQTLRRIRPLGNAFECNVKEEIHRGLTSADMMVALGGVSMLGRRETASQNHTINLTGGGLVSEVDRQLPPARYRYRSAESSRASWAQMNDSDPYDPPHAMSSAPNAELNQRSIPGPLIGIVLGILGAFFIAPALWVFVVIVIEKHALAELLVIPAMIGGGIGVGWASFSRFVLLRVLAWSAAGFGAGLVLEAILMGGLGVGTSITLSGIVLGFVGAVLGIRARPRTACLPNEQPVAQ